VQTTVLFSTNLLTNLSLRVATAPFHRRGNFARGAKVYHVVQELLSLYRARPQWKTGERKINGCMFFITLFTQSLPTNSLFLYKFEIFLYSGDFVRDEWWLDFQKDLVFSQSHCQARQLEFSIRGGGMSPAVSGTEALTGWSTAP